MFNKGGYHTLLGRYMRDYNARRDILRFLGTSGRGTGSQRVPAEPIRVGPEMFIALSGYLRQNSDAPMLMVGVDIGGTLTKMQLFLYKPDEENPEPIGQPFRMQTADPDPQEEPEKGLTAAKSLKKGTEIFANRLIRQIGPECKRVADDLKTELPVVIGVTWPGPIHDGHIAGQSNPLKLLDYRKSTVGFQYTISDIFEVNLARGVQEAWERDIGSIKGLCIPFVALLNDGDGEAVGAISGMSNPGFIQGDHDDGRGLAVIKLGTGLAGGLFRPSGADFELQPGLFEWGKIILDVGAPPKKGFPQGVAGEYLSRRCLPRLAKQHGKKYGCFQEDDLDSGEVGRIAEVQDARENDDPDLGEKFHDLLFECGARQAERSRPWQIPVSVELVRRLLDVKGKIEPELLFSLRIALNIYDLEALFSKVTQDVNQYGWTRLERLVKWQTQPLSIQSSNVDGLDLGDEVKVAAGVAKECIKTLGAYLGDFCVLLHDQLGVSAVILAGGVLSNRTREIAVASARERVKVYGLNLGDPSEEGVFPLTQRAGDVVSAGTGKSGSVDRGTLGAAAFAAASFIQDQKTAGLQKLTACLLPLGSATEVKIVNTEVQVVGGASLSVNGQKVDFSSFALNHDDLVDFMKGPAAEWGYYQSQNDTFIRWVVR